jgi:hypothetical protein
MLSAAAGLLISIYQAASEGWAFAAIALLPTLALFLWLGRAAIRIAAATLRSGKPAPVRRGEDAVREWKDVLGGVFTAVFALALLGVLLLVVPNAARGSGGPKKWIATAMIFTVLLLASIASIRSAWRQLGATSWIKRTVFSHGT